MDELIRRLSSDLKPLPWFSLRQRIFLLSIAGAGLGIVALLAIYGARADLVPALTTEPFWMKAIFAASVVFLSFVLLLDLARPEGDRSLALLLVPISALALIAGMEFATNSTSSWRALVMGMSAGKCSLRIALFGLPTFLFLLGAFRHFAPTQLAKTGFAIGVCAGAVGALVYMFYCNEVAASFVLVWYTLGITLTAALGGLIGPYVLRWR